jgi:hypothetical protein
MDKDSLAARLRGYLKPSTPLGPTDASRIHDVEVAARLFDPHNDSFKTLLRRDLSVLTGRRGSGKTALLNSYAYRPFLDKFARPSIRSASSDYRTYDIVIEIETYKHFDDMQKLVVRNSAAFRPVEAVVDDWESIVLDYFFARLVALDADNEIVAAATAQLRHYLHQDVTDYKHEIRAMVWGSGLIDKLKHLVHHNAPNPDVRLNREDALGIAVEHLNATDRCAVIVFDSMDEYDIENVVFNRTLAALIRFISDFNTRQDKITVKLGLPSEIYPEINRASANPLKDLVNVDQLTWTAVDLEQIAAHRFRLFLELYDPDYAIELSDLDLEKRHVLRAFWKRFFPSLHPNRFGVLENPMTYVLRHTQLLPRQFRLMLHKIILGTAEVTGGYRKFEPAAITAAIETTESQLANEILGAFAHVYPRAERLIRPVLANFPTVFSYDELENRWRKKGRPVARALVPELEMPQFAEMLLRIGIIGLGHDETERYHEGEFSYDALEPTNIGEGHDLCLHPIFSKHFNAAGNPKHKAILPKGVKASSDADEEDS